MMKNFSAKEYIEQAETFVNMQNTTAAIDSFRCAIKLDDKQPLRIYNQLAKQLLKCERLDDAKQVYCDLLQKYPKRPHGTIGLAKLAQINNDWEIALRYWDDCLARFSKNAKIPWFVGKNNMLIKLRRLDEAEDGFNQMAVKWANHPAPLRGLLNIAKAKKDSKRILLHSKALLSLLPNDISIIIEVANIQARLGSPEAAQGVVEKVLTEAVSKPLSISAYIKLFRIIQVTCVGNSRIKALDRLYTLVNCFSENYFSENNEDVSNQLLLAEISFAQRDYQQLSLLVGKCKKSSMDSEKFNSLCRVVEKYQSTSFHDTSAQKIFVIGLSKTGTTSLNSALSLLEFHSIHWGNPHTRAIISQDDLFLFDAFSDMPIACQFETLYHTFPNSLFIYTHRPIKSWVQSISSYYNKVRGINSPAELLAPGAKKRWNYQASFYEAIYTNHHSWEEAYIAHEQRVKHFFNDKPKNRFLELSICEGDGWEKLCPFLGKKTPSQPFPQQNISFNLPSNSIIVKKLTVEEHILQGMEYENLNANKKVSKKAIIDYRLALELNVNQAVAFYFSLAGKLPSNKQFYDVAEEILLKLIRKDPANSQARINLAQLTQCQQLWSLALMRWEECIINLQDEKQVAECCLEKAIVLVELAQYHEAEKIFLVLIKNNKFIPAYIEWFRSLPFCYQGKVLNQQRLEILTYLNEFKFLAKELYTPLLRNIQQDNEVLSASKDESELKHQVKKPDFLIIGAQKCGTTFLHRFLKNHPQIEMTPNYLSLKANNQVKVKEVHFFDKYWYRGSNWYFSLFYQNQKIQGEATPAYFDQHIAHARMYETIPDSKLILLLRDPVARAFSAYNMAVRRNDNPLKPKGYHNDDTPISFEETIQQKLENEFSERLLKIGQYIEHIENFLQYFPREQILIIISENMRRNPGPVYQQIFNFLGVKNIQIEHKTNAGHNYAPMQRETAKKLYAFYRPYNERLFNFLGYRIPEWEHND